MKKDFVPAQNQYPALAKPIEDTQEATRLRRAVLHPTPHCDPTRHAPQGQHNRQPGHKLSQAQAHRRARRGQLALLGLAEFPRLSPGLPKGLIFSPQPLIVGPKVRVAEAASLCLTTACSTR